MLTLTFFTTVGLVKTSNEDNLAVRTSNGKIFLSLCDGHWGKLAASLSSRTLVRNFPKNKKSAVLLLQILEAKLYRKTKNLSRPPETSLIACQFDPESQKLKIVSYGDCRLFIVRNARIIYTQPTKPTWLGAFSFQGQRGRLPVSTGTDFKSLTLKPGDYVFMFTDGVDECIYEVPTIPHRWLAGHAASHILTKVLSYGAQDNASLFILKC